LQIAFNRDMDFAYGAPKAVAPGIVRIVAENPGPLTFKGTNTYILGHKSLIVIDPGPGDKAHEKAVIAAIAGRPVTDILLTHTHRDHSDSLAPIKQATGGRTGGAAVGPVPRGIAHPDPRARSFVDLDFVPDRPLADGDIVKGDGFRLVVIATPGHAPDHLCFAVEGKGILFSGDHIMGWNTTVVAPPEGRMSDYYASLERLMRRRDKIYLSGHGDVIRDPQRLVKAYMLHRRWREEAILASIRDGATTIAQVCQSVYRGVDGPLAYAASLSALAHVEHLIERGLVASSDRPTLQGSYWPVS
jgi:glyoxylase-like metal-dependent hydrolase (beta-lactamase superfamily II)